MDFLSLLKPATWPKRNGELRWQNLNENTLELAQEIGCPVHALLEETETSADGTINRLPGPRFLDRRNKYAHGEA
jgi:hypothetical protein